MTLIYAWALMSNHVHILPSRGAESLDYRVLLASAYLYTPRFPLRIPVCPASQQRPSLIIFDSFSVRITNPQEFGMNLIACYFIVHYHGGRIEVRNREGRGVIFTVSFPIQPKMSSPAEGEEDFISTVMMNDAFWERILAGQN